MIYRPLSVTLLLVVQITLGVFNVLWRVPIPIALLHLVVAEITLLTVASLYKASNPLLDLFVPRDLK